MRPATRLAVAVFCDPQSNQNQSCCWDKSHTYDWLVCEDP